MSKSKRPYLDRVNKRWDPAIWASRKPFGIGEQHPNNFAEITRAIRENRDQLGYAWRILHEGVCDGCALGVAGMHDWTLDGPHLCNIRLRLLRLNTMPALDSALLDDIEPLTHLSSAELRQLGRIPHPMIRRHGEKGFRRTTWDDALDAISDRIRSAGPDRVGFYLTSRGTANETYYVAQKAVRSMGIANIDNAARICHAPSSVALKDGLGISATSCSYSDWIGTDLLVFIGSNPANNQPVTTKYLHYAKKAGTRVISVNTYREPGMERYWVPSIPESALFGTKITDQTFLINTGGDIAFLNGALKHIFENDLADADFIAQHTTGVDALRASLAEQTWSELEAHAGSTEADMRAFGDQVGNARTAIFVWSMGITQHSFGEDGVRAIINLALTRGFIGRERCGVMPIRGHSGVQGGAEMGAYATAFPGTNPVTPEHAAELEEAWGFPVPGVPGLTTPEMIDAGLRGELDVLFSAGGNFMEAMPDPGYIDEALEAIPLRVHQDIVITNQMLIDTGDTVILLPAMSRYETRGGITQTSTERRIMFSPEVEGPRIPEARPEWSVYLEIARRVRPELADRLTFRDTQAIREEIARVVPAYAGIETLHKTGDQLQYGGPYLCEDWNFPTHDGKAHFMAVQLPDADIPEGFFAVSTRRGKQFNTMVHEKKDAITGAIRDAVMMNAADARALGLNEGDEVVLRNDLGEYRGHVAIAPIKPRNLQVHWPEGNILLHPTRRSPESHVPDYNAFVRLERVPAAAD